jgi:predicted DNA binding protein
VWWDVTVAVVTIASDGFALGRALSDARHRIELARSVPLGDEFAPHFWIDALGASEAFEQRIEADPRVERLVRFGGTVDRFLYRIEWSAAMSNGDREFLAALRDHDVLVERAITTTTDEWLFRFRTADRETLSAFHDACSDAGVPIEVRRIAGSPTVDESFGLTDKQREALVLAFDEGYFEVPRGSSLTELADHVGISRQAYTRRLQRALQSSLISMGIRELKR